MLAISTAWNSRCHSDMGEMLLEIKSVGLSAIELGYSLTEEQLEKLFVLAREMGVTVVSVHNFCPLPPCGKHKRFYCDYYRISSLDEEERTHAVEFTKRTIDTACRFSAPVVVLHAGMVELKGGYGKKIFKFYKGGKSSEFRQARDELIIAREKNKEPFLEASIKSLDEILSYAQKVDVKIGLENRYYPAEIPSLEESKYLLRLFGERGLMYWHDIGHAEVNERLEIVSHKTYLETFLNDIAGFHIHDLIGIHDHMAPFTGECDYSKIIPYMDRNVPKVIEAHSQATPFQIKEAVGRLSDMLTL